MIEVPAADFVPEGPERAVSVAHAAQEVLSDIAHASRHAEAVAAARKAASPERIRFNLVHVSNHLGGAIVQQNSSISNLVQLDPRAGAELEKLRDTDSPRSATSWEFAPPGPARGRTPSHLASTVLVALTHARQHCQSSQAAAGDPEQLEFEWSHLSSHIEEALSHQVKYIGAVSEIFPAVAAEFRALAAKSDLGGITGILADADRSGHDLMAGLRCGRCGAPAVPGAGACDECGAAARRAYERGAADVRQRWQGDQMYEGWGGLPGRAAYDSSRGTGSY